MRELLCCLANNQTMVPIVLSLSAVALNHKERTGSHYFALFRTNSAFAKAMNVMVESFGCVVLR